MSTIMLRNAMMIAMVMALLTVSGVAFYFYQRTSGSESEPQVTVDADEDTAIIQKVGRLILLPEERPTVATVSNPEQLKDQPFFAHAKAGDKVLVYSIAKKVYLYDPVGNIIVNVAPLTIETTASTTP